MRKRSLNIQDLELERSQASHGGVHNFEGFTKSPTAADKAKLFKGSPSVSHVFGFATALENNHFLQEKSKTAAKDDSETQLGLLQLERGEKEIIRRCLIRKRRRKPGEPITLLEGEALQDIIIQYEHRAATALHAHQYDKAIQCGRHIMNIVNRIYGKTHPLCIYGGVILGEAYFLKGDLDKAKKYLLAAEKRLEYVDDKKSAQTLRCAIACYIKLGDLFFEESKKSSSVKDTFKKLKTTEAIKVKNIDFAADAYKHAAHMLDEQGGDSTHCHSRLGHLHMEMGQFVAASISYEAALTSAMHFARHIHAPHVLVCQKQLADSLLLRNRFANALEHYLICFEALYNASQEINRNFIFSVNDESDMILLRTRASIALNVATCLRAVGRFSQAVEVAKDVKNDLTLINTGASHSTMHDTSRDDTDHNTHINVLHELNDLKKDGIHQDNITISVRCLENLGHTYTAMGDFVAAEQHYENALGIIDAIQDSDFAMLHRSIIYCAKGDLKVHEVFDEKPTPHMLVELQDSMNVEAGQEHASGSLMIDIDKIPSMMNVEKSMTIGDNFDENAEPPPSYYDENNESKGAMNPSELESSDMVLQDAMLNYKCALDVACARWGANNPQSIKVAARIGHLFYLLKDYSAALREFHNCKRLAQFLDPSYAGFLSALGMAIANILSRGSNSQQQRAITLYVNSLRVVSRMFGADTLNICAAYTGIAEIWYSRGEPASAVRHFLAAESIARKSLGETDRFRLYLLQSIARSYFQLGEARKTLFYLKKIEEILVHCKANGVKLKYIARLHWNATSLLSNWGKCGPDEGVMKELKAVALRTVRSQEGKGRRQ